MKLKNKFIIIFFCLSTVTIFSQNYHWYFLQETIKLTLSLENSDNDSIRGSFILYNNSKKVVVLRKDSYSTITLDKSRIDFSFGVTSGFKMFSEYININIVEPQDSLIIYLPTIKKENFKSIKVRTDFAVLTHKQLKNIKSNLIREKLYFDNIQKNVNDMDICW